MPGHKQNIILEGIYPPLPTFFDAREELDLATYQQHIANLAGTGIAGYVVMGTNGEAVHLTTDERTQVIKAARDVVVPFAGYLPPRQDALSGGQVTRGDVLIIAGCGEQSTRATLVNCQRAAQAGANAALVLPPSYYKSQMDQRALITHYRTIADNSPLPIVIYNMPASAAGLDLDAATICILAEHPNILAVKDSAGNMAKLAQIVAQAPAHFRVFAGNAGYLLPALSVGAVGAVAALANIFPHQVCRVQELFTAGRLAEARALQAGLVAANNAVTIHYGVPGLKAALELTAGQNGLLRADCGYLRSPLQPLTGQEREKLLKILKSVPQLEER
jgi:4-hydroxy-2-oxoglutarate aldolase